MPDKTIFNGINEYVKMGLAASVMISLEWWCFEIQTAIASFISIVATASLVLCMNTLVLISLISYSFSVAASVFVGKAMGESNHRDA